MAKSTATSKKTKKKGPGRGWHGSSSAHAAAGRKGGFARAARWRLAHSQSDSSKEMTNDDNK